MGERAAARIDPALCTGCGQCLENCCVHAICRGEDGLCRCNGVLCFSCGQCAAICPVGAASQIGRAHV